MDSNTRKIAILASVAVMMLVIIVIAMIMQMSGKDDAGEQQEFAELPVSGERTDIAPAEGSENYIPFISSNRGGSEGSGEVIPEGVDGNESEEPLVKETDWRDNIVTYTEPTDAEAGGYHTDVSIPSSNAGSEHAVQDQIDGSFDMDYDYSSQVPTTFDVGDGYTLDADDLADPTSFANAVNPIPSLTEVFEEAKSCGELDVPDDIDDYQDFLENLNTEDEVVCMGEAVADECETSVLSFDLGIGGTARVYVVERADGVCGTGLTLQQEYVNVCSVTAAMNTVSDDNRTFAEWQDEFSDEPGDTFALMYSDLLSTAGGAADLDCQLHSF